MGTLQILRETRQDIIGEGGKRGREEGGKGGRGEGGKGAAMASKPPRRGVKILVVYLCYKNWDNLRLKEPLGSGADINFFNVSFLPFFKLNY